MLILQYWQKVGEQDGQLVMFFVSIPELPIFQYGLLELLYKDLLLDLQTVILARFVEILRDVLRAKTFTLIYV
jgi:hypothetical protein